MKNLKKFTKRIIGFNTIMHRIDDLYRINKEILASQKFNNTITNSEWYRFQSVSPGGSAVDYGMLYTMYKVLNLIHPSNILEFGLGQSSKLIHQYAGFFKKNAITVEHDPLWRDFFLSEIGERYIVNILMLDLERYNYKGHSALTYKNCLDSFNGSKYDLIVVDGPFGYESNTIFSRPQIIDIAKNCLADNFIIIIDDYDRVGERNTVEEIFCYFNQNNIEYTYGVYSASKDHILITTPSLKFLTTL